jgi:hypothetical protein
MRDVFLWMALIFPIVLILLMFGAWLYGYVWPEKVPLEAQTHGKGFLPIGANHVSIVLIGPAERCGDLFEFLVPLFALADERVPFRGHYSAPETPWRPFPWMALTRSGCWRRSGANSARSSMRPRPLSDRAHPAHVRSMVVWQLSILLHNWTPFRNLWSAEDKGGGMSQTEFDQVSEEYRSGRLSRRRFIGRLVAAGVSVPAALVLVDSASATAAAERSTAGAPSTAPCPARAARLRARAATHRRSRGPHPAREAHHPARAAHPPANSSRVVGDSHVSAEWGLVPPI